MELWRSGSGVRFFRFQAAISMRCVSRVAQVRSAGLFANRYKPARKFGTMKMR